MSVIKVAKMTASGSKQRSSAAVGAMVTILSATAYAPAVRADAEKTNAFDMYGFAMGDVIEDTKRTDPDWEDAFRPSKIAVDGDFGSNGQSSISVKQSRFGVKGSLPTGEDGAPINFKFEFDFFGVGVDAGQTTIRLRYFYGEWKQLLAGQTTSLFMDLDVFPNVVDYWGPCGMVFFRNPQVRWTPLQTDTQEFAIALEKPINDIDPGNIRLVEEFADGEIQNDEKAPDFTIHYRAEGALGHLQVAGMLRRVGYDFRANSGEPWQNGAQTGWGIDVSGALKIGEKDKLMLSIVHGRGIASYMNDGGMDLAPTAVYFPTASSPTPVLSAEAVPLTGVLAYYDLYWNSMFSTALGYSVTEVQNTNFQEDVAFHKGQYASVNLLASPNKQVLIGAELMWGRRTNNNGDTGNDVRFQFSAKYSFEREL